LIQHFRTSKVQYLGLESYKMQVKRVCKATQQRIDAIRTGPGRNSCAQSDISSAARK
jgi:hypothetical protein